MQKLTAACGLICDVDCPAYQASQAGDAAAIAEMAKKASEMLGREVSPDNNWCDGCMTEGGRAAECCRDCGIRRCARERGHRTCAACPEYACEQLAAFLADAPGAKAVLESLRG